MINIYTQEQKLRIPSKDTEHSCPSSPNVRNAGDQAEASVVGVSCYLIDAPEAKSHGR